MVHFGHYILANRIPEWQTYYIGYKLLKKKINQYAVHASNASEDERQYIMKSFSRLLDVQIEKVVLFFIQKQGTVAEKLQYLRERHEEALEIFNPDIEAQINSQLFEEYRKIGEELLRLLQYVELNTIGLRKILKKFDKRIGFRFGEHYLASRINHPYSQLQQIFRQVGVGALVATIAQNLSQLHRTYVDTGRQNSSFSFFGRPALPSDVIEKEPIIEEIEGVLRRLTNEATLTSFVAKRLLLPVPEDTAHDVVDEREYHFMSIQLNLWNTFLYMVNYYIIVPTSDDYAEMLNVPSTMNGIVIGCMPLTALISSLVFSWWSNFSYSAPLTVSTLLLIAGNLLYALALYFNCFWLLLAGRALSGLGGARAINRRYLMDHVPLKHLTNASAAFVVAGSLGMAAGPSLAAFFNELDFQILGAPVNSVTAPGWFMTLLWSLYFVWFLLCFKEPERSIVGSPEKVPTANGSVTHALDLKTPLLNDDSQAVKEETVEGVTLVESSGLLNPHSESDDQDLEEKDVEEESVEESKSIQSFSDLRQELTLPVCVLLAVYFMLKFATEMLISESSLITRYYFGWSSGEVGYFIGALGLTVLPVCFVVANYISNMFAERVVVFWSEVLTAVGVLCSISLFPLVKYTPVQYVVSSVILFWSANILEGVNLSLLSKVMSERLSRGVFNCGFLSTEAGTLARAVADGLISLAGKAGLQYLLSLTMLPTLLICILTIIYTRVGYHQLY